VSDQFRVKLWGTRGSLATPGSETTRYGGNTSCVQAQSEDGTLLVLDAGTGIRGLGVALPANVEQVDILLTHLHMDHIQGLGFFRPARTPGVKINIYAPASTTQPLWERLNRYLSPPLFPVMLREFESDVTLHEVPCGDFRIGPFTVSSTLVCHPDPTVGYRISTRGASLAYLPDHEPALGDDSYSSGPDWVSGSALASGVDLLIHDAQYTEKEYERRVGWGHSTISQAIRFAELNRTRQLVPFHHDPSHGDEDLDRMIADAVERIKPTVLVHRGQEGSEFVLG
jgi:phosphoribosyl 1,2-cyclic phosphodiesterase